MKPVRRLGEECVAQIGRRADTGAFLLGRADRRAGENHWRAGLRAGRPERPFVACHGGFVRAVSPG